jgi:hypothetical protein
MNNGEIFGIFKVPRNINICKAFLNSLEENRTSLYKGIKIRLVKYKHYKNVYVLGTNLFDIEKYPNKVIIELYKQRWFVEEYFKIVKCYFNTKITCSKLINNILQEVYIQMIITAISKYIEIVAPTFLPNKYSYNNNKINRNILINTVANDLLYLIFYKNMTNKIIKKISDMLFDLINNVCLIEDNRYNVRARKTPITQFINNKNYDNMLCIT